MARKRGKLRLNGIGTDTEQHEKVDLDILAPTGKRKSAETHLKKQMIDKALAISEDDITEVDEIDPDWMTLSDLSEGKL